MRISITCLFQNCELLQKVPRYYAEESPTFTDYYEGTKIPLEGSAGTACTYDDKPLENSKPKPSFGCTSMHKNTIKGFIFKCDHACDITCDLPLPVARKLFFDHLNRTTVFCKGMTGVGNVRYDGWMTCMSGPFNLTKDACLVYSYG